MENQNVCKICDKIFPSGKAMGGHMRSHKSILRIPPKLGADNQLPKRMSSISETLSGEEAARSLMMLSRDKWSKSKEIKIQENGRDYRLVQTSTRARFQCTMCTKVFQSHQALGGHISSHKKKKNISQESYPRGDEASGKSSDKDQKVFGCLFCSKVFNSSEELDGHNKAHYRVINDQSTTKKFEGELVTDLNFLGSRADGEAKQHIEFLTASNEEREL